MRKLCLSETHLSTFLLVQMGLKTLTSSVETCGRK